MPIARKPGMPMVHVERVDWVSATMGRYPLVVGGAVSCNVWSKFERERGMMVSAVGIAADPSTNGDVIADETLHLPELVVLGEDVDRSSGPDGIVGLVARQADGLGEPNQEMLLATTLTIAFRLDREPALNRLRLRVGPAVAAQARAGEDRCRSF